jgi:hypothetical protein
MNGRDQFAEAQKLLTEAFTALSARRHRPAMTT